MKLTDFLTDVGRPVAYYPELTKITGSVNVSIFLCQLIYWKGKEANPDGWIYKTRDEILQETGLSRTEQETARQKLRGINFLKEKFKGIPRKLYFYLNLDEINKKWLEIQQNSDKTARRSLKNRHKVGFPPTIRQKTCQQYGGKPTSNTAGNLPTTSTEITTEITSSSLPPPLKTVECRKIKNMEEDFEKKTKLPAPFDTLKQHEILEAENICKKKRLNLLKQAAALSLLYKNKTTNNPANLLLKTLREGGVTGGDEIIKTEQERKVKEIERQKKAQEQEAERKEKEKIDREYYKEAEKKLKSLGAEEMKKIERSARESLPPAVKGILALVKSKMYEIVMTSGP